MNFSRLLVKDEIKKGSFQLKFGTEQAKGSSTDHAGNVANGATEDRSARAAKAEEEKEQDLRRRRGRRS